jgi:hypothetical protein
MGEPDSLAVWASRARQRGKAAPCPYRYTRGTRALIPHNTV